MKIIIDSKNVDALKKVCIERELNYQFHEIAEDPTGMVAAYVTSGPNEVSSTTAFFLGAAWMLEQEKEELAKEVSTTGNELR